MKYREYTDAHPNESCTSCKFFVHIVSHCTYKSKEFWCIRDEEHYKAEKARQEEQQPKLFDL